MELTFTIPDKMTARIRKVEVVRDMTALPAVAIRAIFAYGFQRINNDAGAVGKDESNGVAIAKSDKRWNALLAGILRASPVREGDPVKAEAVKIATAKIKDAVKASDRKVADVAAKEIRRLALALIEKDSSITEAARANVERAASITSVVDLDDLGFDPDATDEDESED